MADDSIPQKRCARCKQDLPATLEYFGSNGKYLKSYCKPCAAEISQEWRINNPERIREHEKKSHQNKTMRDPEGVKAKAAIRSHKHYLENKEEKKTQSREGMRRWRENNRDKHRLRERERRSTLKHLPADFSERDWQSALTYFGYKCAYCGRPADF